MRYGKAVAAAVVGLIGWFLLRNGIDFDPELEAALLALVEGAVVWAVPNRP
jgi:hypothetical protein